MYDYIIVPFLCIAYIMYSIFFSKLIKGKNLQVQQLHVFNNLK